MLTPDQLGAAGDAAAERAARAVDVLVSLLSAKVAEAVGAGDLAAALLGSGRVPQAVLRALGADPLLGRAYASGAARTALRESARSDALAAGVEPDYSGLTAAAVEVADGLAEVERRCNLSMAEDARASYLAIVSDLVPRAARSELSREAAVAEGVRRMAERGVRVVEYSSGRRDRPEVVMRRHVQTLLKQASTDYTADLCRRVGVRLVEVDSHVGARPSHRLWQGRAYGLDGPVEVGGVRYPGLAESGAADGLHEPNCRHSMAPYVPGRARRWSETPDEDAGHDPEAYYGATQRQRANERAIRDAKREAAALRAEGLDDAAARIKLGRAQAAQRRLLAEYPALKRRPERERAFDAKGRQVEIRPLSKVPEPFAAERFMPGKAKGTEFDVIRKRVNGKAYMAKYLNGVHEGGIEVPKRASRQLYFESRRMLREMDGTAGERLVAVSWTAGKTVADNYGMAVVDFAADFTDRQKASLKEVEGGVVLLHNHPSSSRPSPADIYSAARPEVRRSIVACHDGTVYELTVEANEATLRRAYEAIYQQVLAEDPMESDRNRVESNAIDRFYKVGEARRWLRLRKL